MKEPTTHTLTLDVTCTEEVANELRLLFKGIATGAANAEQRRREEQWKLPPGYVKLANGTLAQEGTVKEQDELENALVCDLHALHAGVYAGIEHLRNRAREDGAAFIEVLETKYGKKPKTKTDDSQPQMTLMSLDGSLKIVYERDSRVAFGPDIVRAKELVFKCLEKMSEGADPVLVDLAHQAFTRNKDGYIPVGKVAALWRVKCDNPDWQAAMQALKDALRPDGSREYIRFYERNIGGEWQLIRAAL